VLAALAQIVRNQGAIMTTLQEIKDAVAANTDATKSAELLMDQLHAALEDAVASNDPAALQELLDDIKANTKGLGASVVANTPAAGGGTGGGTPPADTVAGGGGQDTAGGGGSDTPPAA
jgi:hypothetical protein